MMAAVVLASLLPASRDNNQKITDSINRLNKVEDGMQRFMAAQGRRPCPADGQYDVNSPNFGVEANNTSGNCTGNTPAAPMGPDAGTGKVIAGTIPTKTLGLPDDYAFDAWGRRFTYEVDKNATSNASCYTLKATNSPGGIAIQTKDAGGTIISTDNVMVAYMSHGPSGYGAWPSQGSNLANRINPGFADNDKENNAGVDLGGSFTYNTTNFTNVLVTKDWKPKQFDDVIFTPDTTKNTCCTGKACRISTGFQAQGTAAADTAGSIITTLDLNGDGIADTAICAPAANSGAGAVYVIFGTKSTTYSTPFALSSSNVIITGVPCTSLAAGDVNRDGVQDLIIGASGFNSNTGAVYVVLGGTGAWPASFNVSALAGSSGGGNGKNGWRIDGENINDKFGASVAARDFNGDDYDDIVIGAPSANSGANDGAAYLIEGSSSIWPASSTIASHMAAGLPAGTCASTNCVLKIASPAGRAEQFGAAVTMGNITANNYANIVIGAPYGVGGSVASGRTYMLCGTASALTTPLDITLLAGIPNATPSQCGTVFNGTALNGHSGMALDVGDINGDGITDLIIGAPNANALGSRANAGASYVVYGSTTFASTYASPFILSSLNYTTTGFRIDGVAGDISGTSLYARCDVNGDGIQDLIIGAPNASAAATGSVYIVFGGATSASTIDASALNNSTNIALYGASAGDKTGTSVSGGDITNSGLCAPIIGAPGVNSGAGAVDTVLGNHNWSSSFNLSTLH